jgi:hypothetical protein
LSYSLKLQDREIPLPYTELLPIIKPSFDVFFLIHPLSSTHAGRCEGIQGRESPQQAEACQR